VADRVPVLVGDRDAELAAGAAGGRRKQLAGEVGVEHTELPRLAGPVVAAGGGAHGDGQVHLRPQFRPGAGISGVSA
jgi:hypothetical protein